MILKNSYAIDQTNDAKKNQKEDIKAITELSMRDNVRDNYCLKYATMQIMS